MQGAARPEDALRVRAQIGRIDQKPLGRGQAEIVGHYSFEDFVVFKLKAHPESFGARTAGEGLPAKRLGIAELANEIYALNVPQIDRHHVSGSVQKFQLSFADEIG